ncbi:hypothetical protein [Thermococcus sp. Bubb.Bath]|uniref:hypothetical protein n=1 Tax=Thermococcus sp. Bubb.Bath TaxID=1638242 RepID=UPI00143C761F|nr:hypothetical protein [Thermococcus sp. Bubb.Bath]NJF25829.1 hypothetical protein [Thermococcus sp. Bubb.Bath]
MVSRKALSLAMVSLFLLSISLNALAEDYSLPGGDYNNIGLKGELVMWVNVTLVNLAPYPKFVVVNPLYDFQVYRFGGTEAMRGVKNETTGSTVHYLPPDLSKNTLNYRVGFWVYAYETVKVAFRITEARHYTLPLKDYSDDCSGSVGISVLRYENGTLVGGKINSVHDLNQPVCGVIYPQLLNSPVVIRLNDILPSMDGYVKMLKYEGSVEFKITDVPDSAGVNDTSEKEFPLLFAVSEPLLFANATSYEYEPPYSMNYTDYMDFILKYRGLSMKKESHAIHQTSEGNGLFPLTNSLISGVSVPEVQKTEPTIKPLDFPIWIVYMGPGVNTLEIRYRVKWENYSG